MDVSILGDKNLVFAAENQKIFKILSIYLNLAPDYIDRAMIEEITGGDGFGVEFAFANLAATACGLDIYGNTNDKTFFKTHFLPCFKKLDIEPYLADPYYANIKFPNGKSGKWTFQTQICKEYEAFVFDDPRLLPDGRIIPCIGFFESDYPYPAVLEDGREWMTLLPNETNTTKPAIEASKGKILTYGLGLGYFAYMASLKPEVESVTVVEKSSDEIELFNQHLLPQFPCKDKIKIIKSDAFDFAQNKMAEGKFDVIFTDLWHDPADGCDLYLRMKAYEHLLPEARFIYWIENTLKLYI